MDSWMQRGWSREQHIKKAAAECAKAAVESVLQMAKERYIAAVRRKNAEKEREQYRKRKAAAALASTSHTAAASARLGNRG